MTNKFDIRQSRFYGILTQLWPFQTFPSMDQITISTDSDLSSPLRVDATSSPSLVINIGPAIVSNPISNRQRSISLIDNLIPAFASGTYTFPSTSGGNITTSTGGSYLLTCPSGQFVAVLLSMDSSGHLIATVGTTNVVQADALVPAPIPNTLPFAYVNLSNVGGTIQNIAQNAIFQFSGAGGSSGSGGGVADEMAISNGTTSVTVTFGAPQPTTTYIVLAQMGNITDSFPQFQPIVISNKTMSGFTATWNSPTDSANYFLDYIVPPGVEDEQVGEQILTVSSTNATVNIPIPLSSTNYVVVAGMVNYTDANPQFQPVVVTGKTDSTFTVEWNAPLDTANYRLAYQVAEYQ